MPTPKIEKCHWCGTQLNRDDCITWAGGSRDIGPTYPTTDHVTPKSRGGTRTVTSCHSCNQSKGAKSAREFLREPTP